MQMQKKCFDKLWLKDSLIETEIRYSKNDIKMLHKINKTTQVVVDNAIANAQSTQITDAIKQGSIFGPTMFCATTAKVNGK